LTEVYDTRSEHGVAGEQLVIVFGPFAELFPELRMRAKIGDGTDKVNGQSPAVQRIVKSKTASL
jgi:hypothetical protein